MPIAVWQQFWRIRSEASFNAATPGGGAEWNIAGNGGGANGWLDLPVVREAEGLQPKSTIIYPSSAAGSRAMNAADPIAGAYPTELGSLEMAVYPEMIDRIFRGIFGTVARVETAGAAALASTAFASVATLDTQPDGTEQLRFTIASSTAASAAVINIIQSTVIQETITIGTNAGTVDGAYYSKGGYDGSTNDITFTVAGTVTAGTVVIDGIDYATNTFTVGNTVPSFVIEQGGRPEAGSGNSEFHPGCVFPSVTLAYERATPESILIATVPVEGLNPTTATAGTYQDDVSTYYKPFAGWTAAVNIDDATYSEVISLNMTIQPNTEIYAVSSGGQNPSGKIEGQFEVFGTVTILPADDARWLDYRAATIRDLEFNFLTPHYVVDTTAYQLLLTMTRMTIEDYSRDQQSQALGATLGFRGIWNTTDSGPITAVIRSRLPV